MNILSKSIIGLLCGTTLAGAYYGYKETQHNQQWQLQQQRNAQYWAHVQWMNLRDFDYALAESLAAPTIADRQSALQSANEDAHLNQQLHTSASATMNLPSWITYESFIVDSSRYLSYPASEKGPSLNPDQLVQIQRMRLFARTALPYLEQMRAVGYHTSIADIQRISTAMEAALSKLDSISTRGNKAFNDFLYARNPYVPAKPGTVFEGEPLYSSSELAAKAEAFMGDSWNEEAGKRIVPFSGGGSPQFGEFMDFELSDNGGHKTSSYIATLSKSGHVLRVARHSKISEEADAKQPLDVDQVVALADDWMTRWSEERLTLVTREQTETSIRLVYVPVREHVSIPQMQVEWQFDRRTGALKNFDAYQYFYNYNQSFPLQPKLTAEQASGKLGPNVNIVGTPTLEIHDGKLVYAFSATGVEGVSRVFVNALTGAGEGIDYSL